MQRTLDLHYDKLVIGADLSALSYAYINKAPILYLRKLEPFKYNINKNFDEQLKLYQDLLFVLSITKYVPFGNLLESIRIEDDNTLKLVTNNLLVAHITFNELIISDDYKISGLSNTDKKTTNLNYVLDWFEANRGCSHNLEFINGDDDFVKKIFFYVTNRIRYNKTKRDCVSVSLIEDENLDLFEYSQTSVGFKTAKMMKDAGIRGKWDKTNNKFKSIKLTSQKRQIFPIGKNLYENTQNIKFLYDDYETILNLNKKQDSYLDLIEEKYGIFR